MLDSDVATFVYSLFDKAVAYIGKVLGTLCIARLVDHLRVFCCEQPQEKATLEDTDICGKSALEHCSGFSPILRARNKKRTTLKATPLTL